eukprot:TRINITY_DN32150_c0_g1_i1.p1 TRINITY_DN32150_c0_g1~~TRINITY_DN32150_c0_g1_i1.p1  ORF type:complete len:143 (-),score=37.15 TRINITY_DN32150_c0_g1_i1:37-465(-)
MNSSQAVKMQDADNLRYRCQLLENENSSIRAAVDRYRKQLGVERSKKSKLAEQLQQAKFDLFGAQKQIERHQSEGSDSGSNPSSRSSTCLLYTSDAADEEDSVDLGGRRIIKKKKKEDKKETSIHETKEKIYSRNESSNSSC